MHFLIFRLVVLKMAENESSAKRQKKDENVGSKSVSEVANEHQDETNQKSSSTKKQQLKLSDLNVDCFLKIMDNLSFDDLYNISNTCHDLRHSAQDVFRSKYTNFDMDKLFCQYDYVKVSNILRNFGGQMTGLKIFLSEIDTLNQMKWLLNRIEVCCLNLKKLALWACDVEKSDEILNRFPLCLNKLEELRLYDFNMKMFDLNMPELKVLDITQSFIVPKNYPNLEEISITISTMDFHYFIPNFSKLTCDVLPQFIQLNPHLKSISIADNYWMYRPDLSFYEAIGQNIMENLTSFELKIACKNEQEYFDIAMSHLAKVKSLEVIKLYCGGCSVTNLLDDFNKNDTKINYLDLNNVIITGNALNQMKHVKHVKLDNVINWNDTQINEMVAELPSQLIELQFTTQHNLNATGIMNLLRRSIDLDCLIIDSPSFIIDTNVYNEIVSIIQNRSKNKKAIIYCSFGKLLVPKDILLENHNWLQIYEGSDYGKLRLIEVDEDEDEVEQ